MEKTLQNQQGKVISHKKYIFDMVNTYSLASLFILLPAFLWGWKIGGEKRISLIMRQLVHFGMLTTLTHFKKKIIYFFYK
jgi:hypothetical protein